MSDRWADSGLARVFVLAPIHDDAMAQLKADVRIEVIAWNQSGVERWIEEADAVILRGLSLKEEDVRRAKRLRVIGRHGAGVDSVPLEAAKARGIAVLNTPFENSRAVAELVVALMMASARKLVHADRLVKIGAWKDGRAGIGSRELNGARVGFVGFGRIARMAATILRDGFDMQIHAYDPLLPEAAWEVSGQGVTLHTEIGALFAPSDFVSINLPLTADTRGLVSDEVLSASKPGLILVNTSRGGIVDEAALAARLRDGTLRAAASDVFEKEPPDPSAALLQLPNFIATPHFGGATEDSLRLVGKTIAAQTILALFGEADAAYRVV